MIARVTIQEILDAVMTLERDIERARVGSPDLAASIARIGELQGELERVRGMQGPLVPDASSPKSPAEQSVDDLDRALRNLLSAASAKQ